MFVFPSKMGTTDKLGNAPSHKKSRSRENRNANYNFTKEKLEVTGDCGLPEVLQSLGLFRDSGVLVFASTPGPQAWCLLSASPLQFRLVDVEAKM